MDSSFKLPQEWLEEGKDFLEKGNLPEARKAFEEALNLDPFYTQALCGLSKVLWKEGNIRESMEVLNRSLEIDPDEPETIEQCAQIFTQLGRRNDALEVLDAYINRNPWDEDIRALRSRLEVTPIEDTSSITEKEPDHKEADFFVTEGESQLEKGRIERARMCFEIALEHDPDNDQAHNNLGVILWNNGEIVESLEHFQKAFHKNPGDNDIVFNSFNALVAAGYLEEARDLIKLHIQQNPFNEEAWSNYDHVLLLLQKIVFKAGDLPPETSRIYTKMAKKLMEIGDLYGAAEALHKAISIDPKNTKALLTLAKLHKKLDHREEAIAFYEEAFKVDEGKSSEITLKYAEYLEKLGLKDKALAILKESYAGVEDPKIKGKIESLEGGN